MTHPVGGYCRLVHDSIAYKKKMQALLEPDDTISPEYDRIFLWCARFEMKCLEAAVRCLMQEKSGYDPSQPRVPRGNTDGGEWTDGGGYSSTIATVSTPNDGRSRGPFGVLERRNPSLQDVSDKPWKPRKLREYEQNTNTSPAVSVESHSKNEITIHYADGSTETRITDPNDLTQTRAWRNNNPGNVVYPGSNDFARRHGAIGGHNGMAVFPDPYTGHMANVVLLKGPSYAPLSIDQAIAKRSPPHENDTERLQREISKRSGLPRNRTIESLDDKEFDRLLEAIYQFEGWGAGKVTRTPPKQ